MKCSVVGLKNVSDVIELKKNGSHRAGPAAFLVLHLDFAKIEMELSDEGGRARDIYSFRLMSPVGHFRSNFGAT